MSNVVKFPYDACRRVHSRKPRRSKNGRPEERAARAADDVAKEPTIRPRKTITGDFLDKFVDALEPERQQTFLADLSKLVHRYWWCKE
jgi:hypothetical protein